MSVMTRTCSLFGIQLRLVLHFTIIPILSWRAGANGTQECSALCGLDRTSSRNISRNVHVQLGISG